VIYPPQFFTEIYSFVISNFFYASAFVREKKVALGHVSLRIFRVFRVIKLYTCHILKCMQLLSVKCLRFVYFCERLTHADDHLPGS
jgi:uncharacterized membrane protein YoaT (DUF817 family)